MTVQGCVGHRQAECQDQRGDDEEAAADAEEPGEQAHGRGGGEHCEGARAVAGE